MGRVKDFAAAGMVLAAAGGVCAAEALLLREALRLFRELPDGRGGSGRQAAGPAGGRFSSRRGGAPAVRRESRREMCGGMEPPERGRICRRDEAGCGTDFPTEAVVLSDRQGGDCAAGPEPARGQGGRFFPDEEEALRSAAMQEGFDNLMRYTAETARGKVCSEMG